MPIESLDILIAIVLIVGLARGVTTGAVRQIVSFLGTVAAIILALELMSPIGRFVGDAVPMADAIEPTVGFVVVFLAIQLGLLFAVRLVEAGIKAFRLTPVNRLVGAGVGTLKAALLLSVVFLVLGFFEMPEQENRQASVLYEPVASVFPATWEYAARHLPMVRNLSDRFGKDVEAVLSDRLP